MILPFVINDLLELFVDYLFLFGVRLVNILDSVVLVLEQPQVVLESQIDQIVPTFLEIFHLGCFVAYDRVKYSVVWLGWRCLLWSHNSAQTLHHLSSGTFVHCNLYSDVGIGQVNGLVTDSCQKYCLEFPLTEHVKHKVSIFVLSLTGKERSVKLLCQKLD